MVKILYSPLKKIQRLSTFGSPAGIVILTLLIFPAALPAQSPQPRTRPAWADAVPTSTGVEVGKKVPPFRIRDQNGQYQDFNSLRGPKGMAIYFVRSADW